MVNSLPVDDAKTLREAAYVLAQVGNYASALPILELVLRTPAADPPACLLYALALAKTGDVDRSYRVYAETERALATMHEDVQRVCQQPLRMVQRLLVQAGRMLDETRGLTERASARSLYD